MKILLAYPYGNIYDDCNIPTVPMGLYYIGAMLKTHGYDVTIANWSALGGDLERIAADLADESPDILGLSIMQFNRLGAVDIAAAARQVLPGVTIVLGGVEATFLWELLLDHYPDIDFVVTGEGEYAFLKLVRALEDPTARAEAIRIAGVALRVGGRAVRPAPPEPIADLDALPMPARFFDFYNLALTRGCPGGCTFCSSPQLWGRGVRSHSINYAVEQIALLNQRGLDHFLISDDTFTRDSETVIAFCDALAAREMDITWWAISRVNHVDARVLSRMRQAGCVQVSYGVESGSPVIRRRFHKGITDADIRKAFALTVSHAMVARAYFIVGSPGETWQTIEQSLALIRRIKPLSACFAPLCIYPGTALYEDFKRRTGSSDDIWLQRDQLLYAETDGATPIARMREYEAHLITRYNALLPSFARTVRLNGGPENAASNAAFLAYLATYWAECFLGGGEQLPEMYDTVRELYDRALRLPPIIAPLPAGSNWPTMPVRTPSW